MFGVTIVIGGSIGSSGAWSTDIAAAETRMSIVLSIMASVMRHGRGDR